MPRRITQEERMPVWMSFMSVALAGMLGNSENDHHSPTELADIAAEIADAAIEKWDTMMETALEIDEEVAEEIGGSGMIPGDHPEGGK